MIYSETLLPETLEQYKANVFIETGTRNSNLVQLALEIGFARAYTIDIKQEVCVAAAARFKNLEGATVCLGDSSVVLGEILAKEYQNDLTIFLDAHEPLTCVAAELNIIAYYLNQLLAAGIRQKWTILIDDMRIFKKKNDWAAKARYFYDNLQEDISCLFSTFLIQQQIINSRIHADDIMVVSLETC